MTFFGCRPRLDLNIQFSSTVFFPFLSVGVELFKTVFYLSHILFVLLSVVAVPMRMHMPVDTFPVRMDDSVDEVKEPITGFLRSILKSILESLRTLIKYIGRYSFYIKSIL